MFKRNMNMKLVAFDTETNGLKFYKNFIHCLTICWDGITGYYVPWKFVDPVLFEENVMSCEHRTGANPKFDLKFFWQHGVSRRVNVTDATDRLAHCITSEVKSGLKPLAYRYTPFGGYDIKLDKWKKETKCDDYTKIPTEILSKYATMDAIATWRIQVELWLLVDEIDRNFPNEKYPEWTIRRWYETQCMEIYKEICNVEWRGIYVNVELMNKYREELTKDLDEKEAELRKIWGVDPDFNIGSTTEVGKLFERLGWECFGRNDAGVYLTNDEAMGAWIRQNMPGAALLAEWRTERTSRNSFLGIIDDKGQETGWLQYIYHDEKDGNPEEGGSYRVQQSYLVMGTETYRFIGKDPNFQNIPTRNKYAGYVKKCIDTPPADLYTIVGDSGTEYNLAEFELVYTNEGYKTAKECFSNMRRLKFIENDPEHPAVLRCGFDKQEDGSFNTPDPKVWFEA
jgi:DNA polymerase I-like protein with 3'-5' exonuclease and polymerase domains